MPDNKQDYAGKKSLRAVATVARPLAARALCKSPLMTLVKNAYIKLDGHCRGHCRGEKLSTRLSSRPRLASLHPLMRPLLRYLLQGHMLRSHLRRLLWKVHQWLLTSRDMEIWSMLSRFALESSGAGVLAS